MSYDEVPEPAEVDMERCGDRMRGNLGITDHEPVPVFVVYRHLPLGGPIDIGRVERPGTGYWSAIVYDMLRRQYRRVSSRCRTRRRAEQAVRAAYKRSGQAVVHGQRRLSRRLAALGYTSGTVYFPEGPCRH